MKKVFFAISLLCMSLSAFAQSPFTCTTQGAKLRYMNTDRNGKEVTQSEIEVTKVEKSGESYSITQVTTIYFNGKKFMKPVEIKATVRDGDVLMDMGGNLSGSVAGAGYALPKRLAVGLELPTGEAKVKAANIDMTQNTTFHKVVAREEVTVPAGTYDCYVVERQYTAEMAGMTVKSTIKTWYARGVGTVKSETYGEDGTLSSGSHLLELTLPK